MNYIDTHAHIDEEGFDLDREAVIQRAQEAGCKAILVPAIDLKSSERIIALCKKYSGYLYPMIGLHPEEVRADYKEVLQQLRQLLSPSGGLRGGGEGTKGMEAAFPPVGETEGGFAIGEVGLDFHWSREFEKEQLEAFEQQVQWSVETQLPLMIHCRKAQNEMVAIIKRYARELPGGVFHCFTGNEHEAAELLQFDRFCLGIGGVFTFKKSHLPEVLPKVVPLSRIVLETDAPYMAPVPLRGQRNEPSYIPNIISLMAKAYGVSDDELCQQTNDNVARIFGITV